MTDENKAAETSAAAVAEPVFDVKDQYTWSPEQRERWNKTGEPPAQPKKAESESAEPPAKEAKSEPEGKRAAESETAPEQGKRERKPWEKKQNADERIAQLTAKIKEFEERERSRAAEPKPPEDKKMAEAATPSIPQPPEKPKFPNLSTWKGTAEEFDAAVQKAADEMMEYPIKKRAFDDATAEFERQKALITERQTKVNDAWKAISSKGAEIYGAEEWKKVVTGHDLPIYTNDPVEIYIRDSDPEMAAHLLQYMGLKKADLQRIIKLPMRQQFKEMEALEAAMREELEGKSESKPEPKTPVEQKPRAPKPPSEVGGRGAAPEDELKSAAASGSFARFEAEQNRRKFVKS